MPAGWPDWKPRKRATPAVVLSPLTEPEWAAMSPKAKWDSQVALRGPDLVHSGTLKFFTTSVIRHRMSGIMRVGGMVNRNLPFVVLCGEPAETSARFDQYHFLSHVKEAAAWLNVPIVWCSAEVWSKMLDGHHSHTHIAKLLMEVTSGDTRASLKTIVNPYESAYENEPPTSPPDSPTEVDNGSL